MLIQNIQYVVVGSMVQLADFWLLAMLVGQVTPVVFMKSRKSIIFDGLDSNHSGVTIMKRRSGHEITYNFIAFCTLKVNRLQIVLGRVRCLTRMPAPTWLCEAEILPSAIVCNPLGALLLW